MHIFDSSNNFLTSGIVGGGTAIACGIGMGLVRSKSKAHVYCFVGDGAEDSGHFWEAVRYATCMDLPVTFIIEDNDLSIETTSKQRWGESNPYVVYGDKVIRYRYTRVYPHVGIGKHIAF